MKIEQLKHIIELCENNNIKELHLIDITSTKFVFYGYDKNNKFWGNDLILEINIK